MDLSRLPAPLRQKLEARLSALPATYRDIVGARLAQLPVAQLELMLGKSSPLLDRLIEKAGGGKSGNEASGVNRSNSGSSAGATSAGASSNAGGSQIGSPARPHTAAKIPGAKSHYNTTVQRGDSPMPSMGVLLIVLLGLAAIAWNLGWLAG